MLQLPSDPPTMLELSPSSLVAALTSPSRSAADAYGVWIDSRLDHTGA